MSYTQNFNELSKDDVLSAGGKGASLGEMTQAGIPVPPGFVVTAQAFDEFLKITDLNVELDAILDNVDHNVMHTVEEASQKIQALITEADMPQEIADEVIEQHKKLGAEFVAVRSSATAEDSKTAAWAGQLDSYLNVTKEHVVEHVQKCWASLFTPRAIFYRFEKGMHGDAISVAVAVQKMVESEVSGIAFSVHPVTQDYDQLIIEAGFGLGEAIVSGSITPDSFVIEKSGWNLLDKNITTQDRGLFRKEGGENEWKDIPTNRGQQPTLTDEEVIELAKLIVRIEQHYGFPVDVEWAKEKGELFIVQSRPITTLSPKTDTSPTLFDGHDWFLTVTRNMSFWHQYLSNEGHYHHMKDFGVDAHLQILTITEDGIHTSAFMHQPNYGEYADAVIEVVKTEKGIRALKELYKSNADDLLGSLDKLKSHLTENTIEKFIKQYRKFSAGLMITATIGRTGGDLLVEKLKNAKIKEGKIAETVAAITYPAEHTPLFNSQVGLLKIASKVQNQVSKEFDVTTALKQWLKQYGHIPVNFCDEPWRLSDAQKQLDGLLNKDCKKEIELLENAQEERVNKKERILQDLNDEEIRILAEAIAEGTYLNEFRKNVFSRVSLEYREVFSTIAAKAKSDNWRDCFYLTPDEMKVIVSGKKTDLAKVVKSRKVAGSYVNDKGESQVLSGNDARKFFQFTQSSKNAGEQSPSVSNVIQGFSANGGSVRGVAKIILGTKDFGKLNPGEILVTTMTSVDFVPIMEKAAAFVTNEGGITSHASIVAREMNKPCVIGTKVATQVLKDGDEVEVDADNGVVRIL